MDPEQRSRLDAALDGGRWRPFAHGDQDAIERALGRAVPPSIRHLWSHFGGGTVPSSHHVIFYDADEVIDLLEQYSDRNLVHLLPLACDNGSRDFAMDLGGRGVPAGRILLLDRSVMTEQSLRHVAADILELVERGRSGALVLD
jgi:hypothetical protein